MPNGFSNPKLVSNGNLVVEGKGEIKEFDFIFRKQNLEGIALITLVDDSTFVQLRIFLIGCGLLLHVQILPLIFMD